MNLFVSFVLLLANLISACSVQAHTGQHIEIFLLDWDVTTRSNLTPDQLRNNSTVTRIVLQKNLLEFVESLDLDQLQSKPTSEGVDVRLVIDIFSEKGVRTTYYADRFNLFSAQGISKVDGIERKFRRPIDVAFREKFRALARLHKQSVPTK